MEEKVSKHVYVSAPLMGNQQLPDSAEILIGGSGLFSLETSPIQEMRFSFGSDKMYWKVQEGGKEKEFVLSMCRDFAYSEADGHIYAGSAAWRTVNTLEMELRRMDGLSGGRMIVRFQEEKLLLEAEEYADQRWGTRHFTASGTDCIWIKRRLNGSKKREKPAEFSAGFCIGVRKSCKRKKTICKA